MNELIYLLCIYRYIIFFSFNAIVGNIYEGSENSNAFIIFTASIDIIAMLLIAIDLVLKRQKLSIKYLLLGFFLLFFYMIYFLEGAKAKPLITGYLISFVPSAFVALSIANGYSLRSVVKWFDILMIFLTMSSLRSSFILIKGIDMTLAGGGSYQIASYIAAFAFSLNLFLLLFGKLYESIRFRFCNNKIYNLFSIVLIPVQVFSVILSGGRGGFILMVVAIVVLGLMRFKEKNRKRYIFWGIMAATVFFLISEFISSIAGDAIMKGAFRVFSYITSSGIDMSQTSERDIIYIDALNFISDKPILGYGIFKYYDIVGRNPHNIFLEILLQGGILYLFFFLFIIMLIIKKLRHIIKIDATNIAIIPLFLFPITNLMFSGTYIAEGMFAFVLIFILCVSYPKVKQIKNSL